MSKSLKALFYLAFSEMTPQKNEPIQVQKLSKKLENFEKRVKKIVKPVQIY